MVIRFGLGDSDDGYTIRGAPLRNDLDYGYCIGLVIVSYRCTASYTLYQLCLCLGDEDYVDTVYTFSSLDTIRKRQMFGSARADTQGRGTRHTSRLII